MNCSGNRSNSSNRSSVWGVQSLEREVVCISNRNIGQIDRSEIDQIDQIDQIDHLDPDLPFWSAVQDRHSTDPTQEVLDHADCTASTRQHELDHTDHTDHTDQESICPERSRSWSGHRSYRSYRSSTRGAITLFPQQQWSQSNSK